MNNISQYRKIMIASCLVLAIPFTIKAEPSNAEPRLGNDSKASEYGQDRCANHTPPFNHQSFEDKRHFGPPHDAGLGMLLPPHLRHLALTDAQQDKIFNIFYPLIPKMREASKQRHALMEDLHKLGNTETLDEAKLKDTTEKLVALERETILTRTQTDHKIYAVLSPEQRAKLAENEAEFQNRFAELPPEPAVFETHRIKESPKIGI